MQTEMQTANANLPAELSNLGNALIQQGEESHALTHPLLKFSTNEGNIWMYGQDGVEVEEGSLWAVNPLSFEHGYVCWKDSKIVGEHMVPAGVATPNASSFEDHGPDSRGKPTRWDAQMSIMLKCISGEDAGTEVKYSTSTKGGVSAIKALSKAVGMQINSGSADVVPVVVLDKDYYTHKEYGKIYTPKLTVDKWMGMDGTDTEAEAEAEAEPPTRSRKRRK